MSEKKENSIYDFKVDDGKGQEIDMSQYKGKALLIVNTASKCGFTPQYEGLEKLHEMYKDLDFEVLAFPCNQFAGQEPGDQEEIEKFCSLTYDVSFPLFKKIDVNGKDAAPLYNFLKEQAPGLLGSKAIKWNFTKFLVDKEGKVIKRYAPKDEPLKLKGDIEKLL